MIYISYNTADKTSVLYLTQILKLQGVDFWIDVEKMVAGDLISIKIEEGLNNSDALIVCIGKNGLSEWQITEINAGYNILKTTNSLRIIPVLLPGSNETLIPTLLKSYSHVNFSESFQNQIEIKNLVSAVKGLEFRQAEGLAKIDGYSKTDKPKNTRAVGVALLYQNEILIVQRAVTQKSGAGLWQIPGGKVKENETPQQAAIREIDEEVGIPITETSLRTITELVDAWVINNSQDFITMSLFMVEISTKNSVVADEFQNYKWIKLSDVFSNQNIIYFGSTSRYLRIIRRFVYLHLPLKEISDCLASNKELPSKLGCASIDASQSIYVFLSLLGFIDDKGNYIASSTLSGNLIKMLSEWALTESVIFEADGDKKWEEKVEEKGDLEEVEKFRAGLFDQHKSLLGLLSHKLPKALSTRHVGDILLTSYNDSNSATYLLIRWDLLACKFQIPAKGLELLNTSVSSIDAARYIVHERLKDTLVDKFEYKYFNKITTSHVGAGSLGDGPILRNFIITVFDLIPKLADNDSILEALSQINDETIATIELEKQLGDNVKRALNFYVWADIKYLELRRKSLMGKKLQGYEEIIKEFGSDFFNQQRTSLRLNSKNRIPVIGQAIIENEGQLDIIIRSY